MLKLLILFMFFVSCSDNPLGDERSTRDRNPPVGATISGWVWTMNSPDNGSLSNDPTPVIVLTGAGSEEGGKVRLYKDSTCTNQIGSTRTIRSGSTHHSNISFDANGADDGLIEFFATVEDVSLNISSCTDTKLSYNLAAGTPLVLISTPARIFQGNESSYDISGRCSEPGLDVIVQVAGIASSTIVCQPNNTWVMTGLDVSLLAEGVVNMTADHTDADGVTAVQAYASTLKDTTSPTLAEVQIFSWNLNSPGNGDNSNDTTPVISLLGAGSEEAGSVSIFSGNTCSNSLQASVDISNGSSIFNSISLQGDGGSDGVRNFFVIVTDAAGNPSVCIDTMLNYILDTVDPTLEVLSSPQITTANQGAYALSGTCSEPGQEVSVSVAGISPAIQPTCSGANTWNVVGLNLTTAAEGSLALLVNHEDHATNSFTLNLNVHKDTTAPTASEVNAFTWSLTSPGSNSISNDVTPFVRLSDAISENGASVQVFDNSGCSSSKGVAQIISSGTTEHSDIIYANDHSDDGVIDFYVVITDTAGNVSGCVDTGLGYSLDTAPPNVGLSTPVDITSSNASSYSLSGICSEPSLALNVTVGAVSAAPQPVCSISGTWSITGMNVSGAAEGSLSVIARLTDAAGNNAIDAISIINKDAIAPTQSEIQALTWTLSSPAESSTSSDATPLLNMSGAGIFEGGSVEIFSDNSCSNSINSPVSINSGASFHNSISFASDGSEDGLKNFYVVVSDAGNNASVCTDTLVSYTLDTTNATLTLSTPVNINAANQANYSLSGTCSEIGQEVTVFVAGSPAATQPSCISGNIWSLTGFNASGLSEGSVAITVNHSDIAGNSAPTVSDTIAKDTTPLSDTAVQALSWSLITPIAGSVSSNISPEISLSGAGAENSGLVQVYLTNACLSPQGSAQVITLGQTNHSDLVLANNGSQDGPVNFFVVLTDSSGNDSNCVDISLGYNLDTQPPTIAITNAPLISSVNQASYTIGGSCSDSGQAVMIDIAGLVPGSAPICSGSNTWILSGFDVTSLSEGVVSISADHNDAGGNSAPTASINTNKDVTAPSVLEVQSLSWSLSSPASGAVSSDNTPIVNLVAANSEEGGSVQLFSNSSCTISQGAQQVITAGVTSHSDINFAIDGSDDGLIHFYTRLSDAAGNISSCVDLSLEYTLDTTNAHVGLNTAADITTLNETGYSISGTCSESGEGVDIVIGTISPAIAPTCNTSNTWTLGSIDISSLSDGNVLITIDHKDVAGNPAMQQTQTVTKDTTGPNSSVINSWTWSMNSPLANSVSSDNSPQVNLSGASVENGGSVQLYSDASCTSAVGSAINISSGMTAHMDILFANDGTADGLKQFFVIVNDSLGNSSSCTNISLEYTLDTLAPTSSEVLAFSWSLSSPLNGSNSQDTSPVLALNGAGTENGASVQVFDNVTCVSSKGSAQTILGGSSLHNDINYLNDGTDDGLISFYTRLTDSAGNISNCIDISQGYTLDTSLPMVAITSAVDITTSNQSNYSLSGTCTEESQDVNIVVGGIAPPLPAICTATSWSVTGLDLSMLGDGNVIITANHSDGFGNNALEATQTVVKDTTAPSSTDILAWTWSQSSPLASTISADGSPIINMSGAVAENGATVQAYLDPVCFETAGTSQVVAAGSTTHNNISFATDGSVDGAIDYYVTVTDTSNNTSDCVNISLGYTLDTVAPTSVEILGFTWSLISPTTGSTSNVISPIITLSDAPSLNGGSVQVFSDSVCTTTLGAAQAISAGGTNHNDFTYANDGSEDGSKNYYVQVTDPGNNTSGCVDISLGYNLDTTAPNVSITTADDITNGTQGAYSLSGTCDSTGSSVIVSVGGISPATAPICNFNTWSISGLNVTSLPEGSVAITANMTDVAGNNASTANVTINKDTSGPSNPSAFILTEWADPSKTETLTWTASMDDVMIDRYEVKLNAPGSTLVNWINIGNITTYTFVDGVDGASFTLTRGVNYTISVRAFDNDGNVSAEITSDVISFYRPTIPVGLDLWFDISDTSTLFQDASCTTPVTTHGDSVACVQSLIGGTRNITTTNTSDRAIYNSGLDSLDFNGTSHGNYVSNISSTIASVFVVARLDSGYASGAGLFNQGSNANSQNMRIDGTTSCFKSSRRGNDDATDFTFGGGVVDFRLASYPNPNQECVTEGEFFIVSGNSSAPVPNLFQLGQQNSGSFWKGAVREVIVYNSGNLNSDAGDKIEGYLACKWDLRDKLPVGHPYRNTDPTNNDNCP